MAVDRHRSPRAVTNLEGRGAQRLTPKGGMRPCRRMPGWGEGYVHEANALGSTDVRTPTMTTPYLVVGFIVIVLALFLVFVLLWRKDAGRADEIAEDTARLDTQPDQGRRQHD